MIRDSKGRFVSTKNNTIAKENNTMMNNKENRMATLQANGINTGKFFNMTLPEGLQPGATISLIINENGEPVFANGANNVTLNQIISDGYVKNTKLYRRFVMAQMFRMLNYVSYNGREKGYDAFLRLNYGYHYQFTMMLEELRVLSKLEDTDYETFKERSHFFTKEVVIATCNDYMKKLAIHIDGLQVKKCKGVPYKKIQGTDIFVEDIDKKVYAPLRYEINRMKAWGKTYADLYRGLNAFMRKMIKLDWRTSKCKNWKDAFKGAGAYYTLQNLVMYHDCWIKLGAYNGVTRSEAIYYLKEKLDEYQGEGWRMFALMKKVIEDNNFDFNKRMKELGVYKR